MCPQRAQYLQLLIEVPHHHDELQLGGAVLKHPALPGFLAFQVVPLDPPQQLEQRRHGHNPAARSTESAWRLPYTHWLPFSCRSAGSNGQRPMPRQLLPKILCSPLHHPEKVGLHRWCAEGAALRLPSRYPFWVKTHAETCSRQLVQGCKTVLDKNDLKEGNWCAMHYRLSIARSCLPVSV